MLRAEELMIGDWVTYKGSTPCKILSITPSFVRIANEKTNTIITSDFEDISPLPLTTEILEKNGWDVEDACYAKYNLPDAYSSLEFYFHESRLRKWWEGVDEWDNHNKVRDITFQCHCSYVHELQHALRLCGLNELADNFKVE